MHDADHDRIEEIGHAVATPVDRECVNTAFNGALAALVHIMSRACPSCRKTLADQLEQNAKYVLDAADSIVAESGREDVPCNAHVN